MWPLRRHAWLGTWLETWPGTWPGTWLGTWLGTWRPVAGFAFVAGLGCAGGCASDGPSTFDVPEGAYSVAFDGAKDMLREMRFELDRVDARAGVITTHPKASAGFATPWDVEQSTLRQEWSDLLNRHFRIVRIEFTPALGAQRAELGSPTAPQGADPDLREHSGPMRATVRVSLERLSRPGWRPSTASIGLSSFAVDTVNGSASFTTPVTRDTRLESRLSAAARERIGVDVQNAAGQDEKSSG